MLENDEIIRERKVLKYLLNSIIENYDINVEENKQFFLFLNKLSSEYFESKENSDFFYVLKENIYLTNIKNNVSDVDIINGLIEKFNYSRLKAKEIFNSIQKIDFYTFNINVIETYVEEIIKNYKVSIVRNELSNLKIFSNDNNLVKLKNTIEKIFDKWNKITYTHNFVEINELVEKYISSINVKYKLNGLSTGFNKIDNCINGLIKGNFIVLAARPSVGKSAFAVQLAHNIVTSELDESEGKIEKWNDEEDAIFFVNLEMSSIELMWRFLACKTKIYIKSISQKRLSDSQKASLEYVKKTHWNKKKIFVNKIASLSVNNIIELINNIQINKKCKIRVLIIDYIQLIQNISSFGRTREQEVAEVSRKLKLIAREKNITIIALSQLSRKIEGREDKIPILSDLRESGAIEQDADIIMFLYNQKQSKKKNKNKDENDVEDENDDEDEKYLNENIEYDDNEIYLKIGKNRNGKLTTIKFNFEKDKSIFYEC